jgi:hypothetical protein
VARLVGGSGESDLPPMGGEFGDLTVGGQVAPAGLPVWQAGPVLFPVGEVASSQQWSSRALMPR